MTETFDLERFVQAQAPVISQVQRELRAGEKRTHWMWFVFPQLRGLGQSTTAKHFGIGSMAEAKAFLEHPVLGPRLVENTKLVTAVAGRTVHQIFGYPDDLKFHSSMTLFATIQNKETAFREALGKYFDGEMDTSTIELLRGD